MARYVDFLSTDMSAHAGCHGQDGAQTSRSSPSSQGAVWKHRSLGTAQRRQEKHRRAQENLRANVLESQVPSRNALRASLALTSPTSYLYP